MRKQANRLFKTATRRYFVAGAAFGCLFPLVATGISIMEAQLPFTLASVIAVQQTQPLLWIIDTAPVFLGLFAALAGRREDALRTMNASLRELSTSLAARERETARFLDERTAQLRASTEVANIVSSMLNPDELIHQVTQLIADRFNYYYVALFLVSGDSRWAVLQDATGEAGRVLKEGGLQLKVGTDSLVGYAILRREPRIVQNVNQDPAHPANPLLPKTQSEIALPLVVGNDVLGALDIQSKQLAAFDEGAITALQGMATQITIALQNARSFSRLQAALDYTTRQYQLSRTLFAATTPRDAYAALGQAFAILSDIDRISLLIVAERDLNGEPLEYELATEWDVLGGVQLDPGMRYPVAEVPLAALAAPDEVIIIRDANEPRLPAMTRERLAQAGAQAVVLAPLTIGGRDAGFIAGVSQQPRDFSDSDTRLLRSIAEQLGLVLNNLRLTEQMQTTLERVALLNRRLSTEAWLRYLTSRSGLAFESGQAAQGSNASRIHVPIEIRGETIGAFDLADSNPDRQWNAEDQTMLQTIAGEVALAIDNARLIAVTEERFARERALAEATDKVRRNTDVERILETTAAELARHLNATTVAVRLNPDSNEEAIPGQL